MPYAKNFRRFVQGLSQTVTSKDKIMTKAWTSVLMERERQDAKWGEQNHSRDRWFTILGEEVGEACEASLEHADMSYRAEMVQVAAVALAAIESFDRSKNWK